MKKLQEYEQMKCSECGKSTQQDRDNWMKYPPGASGMIYSAVNELEDYHNLGRWHRCNLHPLKYALTTVRSLPMWSM